MSIFIYGARRSAIGKFKKSLSSTSCRLLGTQVVKTLIGELGIPATSIDKLYAGNVLSAGLGQNIARQIQLDSNIPEDKCAASINMVCGSGLKAVSLAYNEIKSNVSQYIIAGGVENMSMAPILKDRFDDNAEVVDSMIYDAITDVFSNKHMGITAENVAKKYNVTRRQQDAFAYESHMKAVEAISNKRFCDEIVDIRTISGDIFNVDEFPRVDTSLEALSSLKPAFSEKGTVTAGNSSGINDGAAFILVGSGTSDLAPLVEIIDFSEIGCSPDYMGMGPYFAIKKLLNNNRLSLLDVDLYEINEAFASQSVAVINELISDFNVSEEDFKQRINVNGGAIALGHPVGASGARILVTLIHEMKKSNKEYGIASLCIGGGMGIAVLVRNV